MGTGPDVRGRRRSLPGVLVAATLLAGCGAGGASPAPSGTATPEESAATASAQAQVRRECPSPTVAPSPLPAEVDVGAAAGQGQTVEQLAQEQHEEGQAGILDSWLACTYPDAYAPLRVEYEPQFHAVVSLTDEAGADPLAQAPVGVLDGRVELVRVPYSQVQMLVLGQRVDDVLPGCDAPPPSYSIDVDAVRLYSPEPAVVEECLDAADDRGDLGRDPGRAQVEVLDGGASAAVAAR